MSSLRVITSLEEIDREKWAEFVFNNSCGNIFQTPYMYEVFQATKNYEPLILIAKKSDEITGVLSAVVIKERTGILGKFSARSLIIGGPLIKDNQQDTLKQLTTEYERLISDKAIYTEIREIFNLPYAEFIFKHGYQEEKRLNIFVDLSKTEKQLWNEIHSKRRNEIKRAEKKGILIKEITELEDIVKSYNVLLEVYKRAKLPLADKSLFLSCYKYLRPEKLVKFIGAYYEDILIGTMITLCYKDRVIDWYAGSSSVHYDKNPNDVIPWETFKISKNEGYKIFDFGGAGKPDVAYGVRDYKKKFGGELIELNRYQKVHKPILMQIGKLGLKLWQKIN